MNSTSKTEVTAAARKALILADPLYYSWPEKKQEKFRVTMDEKTRQKVEMFLLDSLLDIQCSPEELSDVWSNISLEKLNIINWALLLTRGIGEDTIYLNEYLADDKSLLDFTTLYDYDYADFLFQEETKKKEFKNYKETNYFAFRWPPWIRLLIEEEFYYATFTSVATYLYDDIEEAGREYIEKLIPHNLIEGKNHGKHEKEGVLWDLKEDANGQEEQLKELQYRWYPYLQERWLIISQSSSKLKPAIYIKDFDCDDDLQRSFIFTNEETLKKIRWRYLLSDNQPLMADYSIIEEQLEEEIGKAKLFLDDNYQNIVENFDPKIVKLRKKRKIILSSGFFDD
ncbi:MAG: hypothetical protein V3U87_16530 [Methylococcaceae bacterium]